MVNILSHILLWLAELFAEVNLCLHLYWSSAAVLSITINVCLSVYPCLCVLHIHSYTSGWIWTKFVTEVKGCTGLTTPLAIGKPPGKMMGYTSPLLQLVWIAPPLVKLSATGWIEFPQTGAWLSSSVVILTTTWLAFPVTGNGYFCLYFINSYHDFYFISLKKKNL